MADITLSKAVRSNLLSLQNTSQLLSKTQERLATGLKVNSALDNPTNFFTASSLNSRAGDLSRLLDAVTNATQTIEAASNGITAITKLIESAQATARQALQSAGQVVKNEVVGDSGAPYNPKALSILSGDNSAAGTNTGALTADAAATSTLTIGADRADGAVTLGGATVFANDAALLSAAGSLQVGDTFTIQIDNGGATPDTVTVTVAAANAGATVVAGDATNATLSVELDATLGNFRTALNTALDQLGGGTSNVIAGGGAGALTLTAEDSTVESIRVSGRDGTTAFDSSVLSDLGFGSTGTAIGGEAADRFITRNAAIDALAADGDTLTLSTGSASTWAALGTVTFGAGVTAVKTRAQLTSALAAMSGSITAAVNGGGTGIDISIANTSDFGTGLRFSQGSGDGTLVAFNLIGSDGGSVGDSGNADRATYDPTNLLTQGAVQSGDSIEIKIGTQATKTIVFGTGANQVKSLAELNSALTSLSGGAASVDSRGEINVTSDRAQDSITIGGTPLALSRFGLTAGETNNLLTATSGIEAGDKLNIQVGTNSLLTVTFGTGSGQVNTFAELQDALNNLAGGTATIDGTTGAITVKATNGADTVTITSSDSLNVADDAVAEAFGLINSTTPIQPVTVNSSVRTALEEQYNILLTQISDLAQDASFNGINLLNGSDLNVLFNEAGTSSLTIQGVVVNAAGLGLSSIPPDYFQTDANVESSLDSLQGANDTLRSLASTFGSNLSVVEARQDFTKKMINTLETGAANLTLADTNEEAANLLALQTRQQLSSTALSLASQADQNVLRLFS